VPGLSNPLSNRPNERGTAGWRDVLVDRASRVSAGLPSAVNMRTRDDRILRRYEYLGKDAISKGRAVFRMGDPSASRFEALRAWRLIQR